MQGNKKCPAATFAELTKDYINSHLDKNITCVHDDKGHITWFYYDNHHWKEDKGGIYLKLFFQGEYIKSFHTMHDDFIKLKKSRELLLMMN